MSQEATPHLLVMTATIKPPVGVIASHRNDPAQRMKDYAEALAYFLSDQCQLIDRIVFIDNSAADLGPLERLVEESGSAKQIELLSFYGLDYPPDYTKGYGEFKLLDHGFENARLLRQMDDQDKWWKVTGRYRATNIDQLVRTAPRDYDLYADFRWRKRRVDVRLMSFSRGGYERLILGRYPEMAGIQLEDWFFLKFAPLIAGRDAQAAGIVPELRHVPRIEGIGGFQNVNYMTGKYRMIYHARATMQFFKNLLRPGRSSQTGRMPTPPRDRQRVAP
jgi:hypothetical protein